MNKHKKGRGFTLVELIVVITILAILGTIGFISLMGFQKTARESARISDLTTISKALDFFYIQENHYPKPTDFFLVTYSGSVAWSQGTFGVDTQRDTKRISTIPTDPLTGNEYAYSVTNTGQEYELGAISEKGFSYNNYGESSTYAQLTNLVPQANAANTYYTNIKGNYNKEIVTVRDSERIYILGVPTIITTEVNDVTVQDILSNRSFALKNSQNLPGSYSGSLSQGETIEDFSSGFIPGLVQGTTLPVLYDGDISDLNDDHKKGLFGENLFSYYQNSNISEGNILNMPTTKILNHVNTLIQTNTGGIPGDKIEVNVALNDVPYYLSNTFVSTWDTLGTTFFRIILTSGTSGYTVYYENIDNPLESGTQNGNSATTDIIVPTPGKYFVKITGDFPGIYYNNNIEADKITSIIQWGDVGWERTTRAFYGASNLLSVPKNTIGLENVTDMSAMFRGANSLVPDLSKWDVSNVENMSQMFYQVSTLNTDVSQWDVSSVENMSQMFRSVGTFNADLSQWDVSSVENMSQMFRDVHTFTSDLSDWDVSSVEDMGQMFRNNYIFTSDLSDWEVGSVITMRRMFWNTTEFDSNLTGWDVSLVTDVSGDSDFDEGGSGISPGNYPLW